jgi:hypothetical protein
MSHPSQYYYCVTQVADMLDSVTHTKLCSEVHQWHNGIIAEIQHSAKHPCGADMEIPDATRDYIGFATLERRDLP